MVPAGRRDRALPRRRDCGGTWSLQGLPAGRGDLPRGGLALLPSAVSRSSRSLERSAVCEGGWRTRRVEERRCASGMCEGRVGRKGERVRLGSGTEVSSSNGPPLCPTKWFISVSFCKEEEKQEKRKRPGSRGVDDVQVSVAFVRGYATIFCCSRRLRGPSRIWYSVFYGFYFLNTSNCNYIFFVQRQQRALEL